MLPLSLIHISMCIRDRYETLKQDTIEFFDWFVDEGFISCGKTVDTGTDRFVADILRPDNRNPAQDGMARSDCT